MIKFNRKRLNNKGFTLVELLAVVVILAVVMGIAATQVLSSMNSSRMGSLQNSAKKVSQAFQTKYSEAMVTNQMKDVYGTVLGSTKGYDLSIASDTAPVFAYLTDGLKDELNLSPSTYELATSASKISITNKKLTATDSFIAFNGSTVVACMVAVQGGSYYVADAADSTKKATIHGVEVTFASGGTGADMWACSSEGVQSWVD